MTDTHEIANEIRHLRTRLDELEAKLHLIAAPPQGPSFADLRGMLAGTPELTPEAIDRCLYRGRADLDL